MIYKFKFENDRLSLNGRDIRSIWMISPDSHISGIYIRSVFDPNDFLIKKADIREIEVNGKAFDSIEKLSEALDPILFNGGRADESAGGSVEVESEDPYSAYLKELTN